MTDLKLTLGFLAQPAVPQQDGIASVALTVEPASSNANDLDTMVGDTVTWELFQGGPSWSANTVIRLITIGQKTGTVLLTQSAFAPGSGQTFLPVEPGESSWVPPGVTNVYKLEAPGDKGSPPPELQVINSLPSSGQAYQYRIVLHSPAVGGAGIWWIDPEIDICPP